MHVKITAVRKDPLYTTYNLAALVAPSLVYISAIQQNSVMMEISHIVAVKYGSH